MTHDANASDTERHRSNAAWMKNYPTPYAEVNVVVQAVLDGGRVILGDHFIGMYLGGSLAAGDFDTASDVDVYVQVTTIADAGTSMVNLPNTM